MPSPHSSIGNPLVDKSKLKGLAGGKAAAGKDLGAAFGKVAAEMLGAKKRKKRPTEKQHQIMAERSKRPKITPTNI